MTEQICPITLEPIRTPRALACMHVFEEEVINNWTNTNNNCPVCRHSTNEVNNGVVDVPATPFNPFLIEGGSVFINARDPFNGERMMMHRALVTYLDFSESHADRILQSYIDGVTVTSILHKIFISYGREGDDTLLCFHPSMIIDYKKISKRLRRIIRCARLCNGSSLIPPHALSIFDILTRTIIRDAEEFYGKIVMCCGGGDEAQTTPARVEDRGDLLTIPREEEYNHRPRRICRGMPYTV